MKKLRFAAVMCLAMALTLTACSHKAKDGTPAIKKSGILRVAIAQGSNGLTEKVAGTDNYSGMEPELVQQIASDLGVTIQYVPVGEEEKPEDKIESGEADLAIGSIVSTDDMRRLYGVSDSYASGFLYVVTRRGNYSNCAAAFDNGTIGLSSKLSTGSMIVVSTVDTSSKKVYTDPETAGSDLEAGFIDGYFCYQEEALKLAKQSDIFQTQNLNSSDKENYVIIASAGNKKLIDSVNTSINSYLSVEDITATAAETTAAE